MLCGLAHLFVHPEIYIAILNCPPGHRVQCAQHMILHHCMQICRNARSTAGLNLGFPVFSSDNSRYDDAAQVGSFVELS
jgi:hypothetical protein